MSKKKKTLDEFLEEALGSEDEQLYELPENWCWVKLGSVITLISGRDISSGVCNSEGKGTPYIMGASNFVDGELVIERWIEEPTVIGNEGDILLSVKGTIGKILIQKNEKCHLSRQVMGIRVNNKCERKYIYYYLLTYINKLKEASKGVIPGISREDILNIEVPIAPKSIQQQVVNKIGILFAKIDEAKQLIEEAKETFELRRAAILEKIFKDPNNNQYKIIGGISNVKGGKRLPKGETLVDYDTGFPYIKAGDLKFGTVIPDKIQYLLPETHEKIKNYKVSTNDVYITIVGACIGDVGIIPSDFEGANLTENAAKITNIQGFLPKYIAIWLSSNEAQSEIKQSIASATLGKLSLIKIKELRVPIKTLEEQEQAIKIYRNFMSKEEKVLDIMRSVDLDLLRQSVLAKAFKGKLSTNAPTDESAIELLKSILQEKI
ncbi:restriction endonuclease subunit S [Solibacillus sp. R5-41]|uniref:restriction endonuclease subunit S n=1 Tax=Solibacillus sp. R5-41 TaxID=2048654 RepID=UPI0015625AA8|nr:restriction endonuclease subunit S [Solibacillus sp. R5-41]